MDREVVEQELEALRRQDLADHRKNAVGFRNIAVSNCRVIDWHIVHAIAHTRLDRTRRAGLARPTSPDSGRGCGCMRPNHPLRRFPCICTSNHGLPRCHAGESKKGNARAIERGGPKVGTGDVRPGTERNPSRARCLRARVPVGFGRLCRNAGFAVPDRHE